MNIVGKFSCGKNERANDSRFVLVALFKWTQYKEAHTWLRKSTKNRKILKD
jgi:predicted nucleic acid binding AN1-type Zn finger protein